MLLAQEGQCILVAPLPLELARVTEKQPCLAHQVERRVCETEILLERRSMTDPLAQALCQDQARVGEAQHVTDPRRRVRGVRSGRSRRGRAHSVFTSSGMS